MRQAVAEPETRREIGFRAEDVDTVRYVSKPRQNQLAGSGIPVDKPSLLPGLNRFKIVVANSVVYGQLRRGFPDVLPVECQAGLPLSGHPPVNCPIKVARHAQKEGSHAETGAGDFRATGYGSGELEVSPRTGIDGLKFEPVPPDIGSPAELMVAAQFGPIVDELKGRGPVEAGNTDAAQDAHEPPTDRSILDVDTCQTFCSGIIHFDGRDAHFVVRFESRIGLKTSQAESDHAHASLSQQSGAECMGVVERCLLTARVAGLGAQAADGGSPRLRSE